MLHSAHKTKNARSIQEIVFFFFKLCPCCVPFRALVHINVRADRLLILVFFVRLASQSFRRSVAFGDKCRRIRFSLCPWRRLLLRKNTGREPRTLVCRAMRRLPGNAGTDFTACVILMMQLSHWFIPVSIRQISWNFITDAKKWKEYFAFRWCDVVSSLILFSLVFLQLACGTCECMDYTCRAQPEAGRFSANQSPGMYRAVRFLESFLTDLEYGSVFWYS